VEVLLALQIVIIVQEVVARLYRLDLWLIYRRGAFVSQPQADQANRWVSTPSLIGSLAFIVTGVLWLIWQHRAQSNAIAITHTRLQFTPDWAVGWWFIPFANLVKPFQAVRELWKASHGPGWQNLATWRLIGWWWATWLAGVVTMGLWSGGDRLVIGSSSSSVNSISGMIATDRFAVALLAVRAISAVLAIAIVRSITRLQARAFAVAPATAPRPDERVGASMASARRLTPMMKDPLAPGEQAWVLVVVIAMVVLAVGGLAWTERTHARRGEVPVDVPIALPLPGDLTQLGANGVRFSYPSTWISKEMASNGPGQAWPHPMWTSTFTPKGEPVGVTTSAYRLPHDRAERTEAQRRAFVTRYARRVAEDLSGTATTGTIEAVLFGGSQGYRVDVSQGATSSPVTTEVNVMLNGPFAYVVRCESTPRTSVEVARGCAAILSTYTVVRRPPVQVP